MKIVHFTDSYKPSIDGVVTSVLTFTNHLRKLGHEVHIVCPGAKGLLPSKYIHTQPSIPFWGYKNHWVGLPRLFKLRKLLRQIRPDIIHIQTEGPVGFAGLLLARKLDIPTISTYHTLLTAYSDYIKIFGMSEEWAIKFIMLYTNIFHNFCFRTIAPSRAIRRILRSQGVWREIFVLPTGVELDEFKSTVEVKRDPYLLLHTGRLCKEKSIDKVILAFAAITNILPQTKLVITSDGPERKKLEKLATLLGLQEKIQFTGFIRRKKLINLYKAAGLFIAASRTETQGLVALEANAGGCPALVPRALGFKDLVRNGQNGYFYRNTAELVGRVVHIFNNPELQVQLSIGAKTRANQLSIQRQAERLSRLYADTVRTYRRIIAKRKYWNRYFGRLLKAPWVQPVFISIPKWLQQKSYR